MANKLYAMEQLTEEVARDIAAKPEEWMRFLDIASRLYKYTFDEQLLIFAQRPEATACKCNVLLRGFQVAAWMVVEQKNGSGIR